MDKRKQGRLDVPPEANALTVLILCMLGFSWVIWLFKQEGEPVPFRYWGGLIACFVVLLMYCRHYTITEQYLIVRFCGIPYRWIRWEKVSGVAYIAKMTNRYGATFPRSILITLRPRLPFVESTHQALSWFLFRNMFFVFQLYPPKGRDEEYLKALEKRVSCPVITIGI